MKKTNGLRTWVDIDTSVIAHNLELFRGVVGKEKKIMGVVKSNAYGHGFIEFSHELEKLHIDWLGVDSVVEALPLRKEGVKTPMLVLGHTLPERVTEAVDHDITLTVSSMDSLKAWKEFGIKIKVHVKVDTGLHRQGFLKSEIMEVVEYLKSHKDHFEVNGLYTHFAQAKDPHNKTYTLEQLEEFKMWIDTFKKAGFTPLVHAAATAGTLLYPEAHFDMVRVGAGLYGIWPSFEVKQAFEKSLSLKPVLTWKTLIVEMKRLQAGSKISYNLTETLSRKSTIAICAVGYWHGFPRSLSNVGTVLIKGMKAKVLGIVAMDMIIVDVTEIDNLELYEEVVIIGKSGNKEQTARDIAERAGTTSYEILTRLNSRLYKNYL
jgi:alanine racemase